MSLQNKKTTNLQLLETISRELGYSVSLIPTSSTKSRVLKISDGNRFYLASPGRYGFYPNVSRWHTALFEDKFTTQHILNQAGYKVIPTVLVNCKSKPQQILKKIKSTLHGFPLVLKPNDGLRGKNVTTATTLKQLEKKLSQILTQDKKFLIQPLLKSREYRILIANYKAVAMQQKEPPSIVGDGNNSIATLLKQVNKNDIDHNTLAETLAEMRYDLNSIPKKDEMIPYHMVGKNTSLTKSNKLYIGNQIPIAVRQWAEILSQHLNCPVIGIDIFSLGPLRNTDDFMIIELNSNPGFDYFVNQFNSNATLTTIWRKILSDYFTNS